MPSPRPTSLAACLLLCSVALGQLPTKPERYPEWRPLGDMPGAAPYVAQIADTPADVDRLYAATSAGILASYDRGLSWELRSRSPEGYQSWGHLAVSPVDAELLLFSALGGGVWRSVDGGATWAPSPGPPGDGWWHPAPTFAPSAPDTVYVGALDGVWRSDDAGLHFTEVLGGLAGGVVMGVAVDHADALHVYLRTSSLGVYETLDGGATWAIKADPGNPLSLAVDPVDGDRLLLGNTGGKLYLSTDAGASWTNVTSGLPDAYADLLSFDPLDPNRFYAGLRGGGLALSDDGGGSWSVSADPGLDAAGGAPLTIVASALHPTLLVVGDSGGFFRSDDRGQTFQRANDGLESLAGIAYVVVDPFDPAHLVAKTGGSAYGSSDGGATWTEATGFRDFSALELAADEVVPGRFYVPGQFGGFWRSDDGGSTFYESFPSSVWFVHAATHPTVGGRVYAAGQGLWRSDDGGLSFVQEAGVPLGWCWGLAISPVDPNVLYCSGSASLYRSVDGGVTWTAAALPPAGTVRHIVADPDDADVAYATCPEVGLFRTDDRGMTWSTSADALRFADHVVVPAFDTGLVIANDFYRPATLYSRDQGGSAFDLRRGPTSVVSSFASSPSELYAGTYGSGVMVLKR